MHLRQYSFNCQTFDKYFRQSFFAIIIMNNFCIMVFTTDLKVFMIGAYFLSCERVNGIWEYVGQFSRSLIPKNIISKIRYTLRRSFSGSWQHFTKTIFNVFVFWSLRIFTFFSFILTWRYGLSNLVNLRIPLNCGPTGTIVKFFGLERERKNFNLCLSLTDRDWFSLFQTFIIGFHLFETFDRYCVVSPLTVGKIELDMQYENTRLTLLSFSKAKRKSPKVTKIYLFCYTEIKYYLGHCFGHAF